MRIIIVISVCVAIGATEETWNPFSAIHPLEENPSNVPSIFDNPTIKMRAFFEEQRNKVEQVINYSLESAKKVKNSVNDFVGEKQRKLSIDINNYVESVKESGRKVSETFSYVPIEEKDARLDNPDLVLSVPGIITRNGYICETHTVISQGYMLGLHRIPRSRTGMETPSKTVLLQHGLFASSADWILNGPEKGLAYVLADAGYDVWMSNVRGNKYSREHAWLKTSSKSYWNFSWHEVAEHDIPAIIDYIINLKGTSTKISYVGHSMGTAIMFAMLTVRPEYNKILSRGIALAPVVFLSDIESPLKSLAPIASNVAYMEMMYGSHEFLPKNSALGKLSSSCDTSNPDSSMCKNVIFYLCGSDEKQFNKSIMPVFLSKLGTGTSWKTAVHFAQEVMAGGKFQQFDYGYYNNFKVYGSENPPEYDLSKITLPISLFWAKNDLLSSEKDVMALYEKLHKKTTDLYLIPHPEFNHLDYLWAIDAPTLVNNKVLETLN